MDRIKNQCLLFLLVWMPSLSSCKSLMGPLPEPVVKHSVQNEILHFDTLKKGCFVKATPEQWLALESLSGVSEQDPESYSFSVNGKYASINHTVDAFWDEEWKSSTRVWKLGDRILKIDDCKISDFIRASKGGGRTYEPKAWYGEMSKFGLLLVGPPEKIRDSIRNVMILRNGKAITINIK